MDWMYRLGGYNELVALIHEIESMDRYGKNLTFEEYVEYMIRRTQDITVGLSQTEVKIIDALQKDATISYRQISESTGLSESWISNTINRLKAALEARQPASIELCALLHKNIAVDLTLEPRWKGFDAPEEFLVGYGLDHAEDFRHLPFVASI